MVTAYLKAPIPRSIELFSASRSAEEGEERYQPGNAQSIAQETPSAASSADASLALETAGVFVDILQLAPIHPSRGAGEGRAGGRGEH